MSTRFHGLIPEKKVFENQFLIAKTVPANNAYVESISIYNWNVYFYSEIKRNKLFDIKGRLIGLFIGTLIDYAQCQVVEDDLTISLLSENESAIDGIIEDYIYSYSGSFLFLYCDGFHERIYLDASGSRSVVYSVGLRQAAATTGLMLEDEEYIDKFDTELYRVLDVIHEGWFPAGLTAHSGVKRLLCNHYLDLKTWNTHRHWPKKEIETARSARDHAVRIAEIIQGTVKAMVCSGKTACSLTGGNETRFLLAACRPQIHDLNFFTVNSSAGARDVYIAKKIANKFQLKFRVLDVIFASSEEQRIWQYRSSHCIGDSMMLTHPSVRPTDLFKYSIGGLGGEVARAFFWRPEDTINMGLSADNITNRFGMPFHSRVSEAVSEWFKSVESFNAFTQLDLAYMELRMSSWAFVHSYASKNRINPMICREIYQLMQELSPEDKRHANFISEGIDALWPELMEFPINKYGNYMDAVYLMKRLSNPKRVMKKIRKTFR